jgi:hypothetical protein
MVSGVVPAVPDGTAQGAPVFGQGMTDDPVTWNTPQSVLPRRQKAFSKPVLAAPDAQADQVLSSVSSFSSTSVSANSAYEVSEGFGSDLPLVMAIRQIVPAKYGFVFDEGVDLSSKVSWQGGKAWDAVLQDALVPVGLSASVRGDVVSIGRGAAVNDAPVMADFTPDAFSAAKKPMAVLPVSAVASVADAVPAAVPSAPENTVWAASRNSTLRAILEDWTSRAGVELYWASEYDYPIQTAVKIDGSFENAVQILLKGLSESKPRPMARLHPNLPEGPSVLVVETRQSTM